MNFNHLRKSCARTQFLLLIFMTGLLSVQNCDARQKVQPEDKISLQLDQTIQRFKERFEVPGMSVAIIRGGDVIYRSRPGNAHLEDQRPVKDETVFSLYSVTKLFVAVSVFQLKEQDKLSIEDPIGQHLEDLPASWAQIRIRNLLTHSSGLPEIAVYGKLSESEASANVFQDEMLFEAGSRFRYTQTNYWILRRIIEKLSGSSLQDFIMQNQFQDAAPDSVLFIDNNTQRLDVRAKSYLPDDQQLLKPSTFDGPDFLIGAGGLNLTMDEFIAWSNRFDNEELISKKTIASMWQPFEFVAEEFPMAYGWGIYSLAGKQSYGFTGGGRVGFRKFPEQGLSIILLTNGYRIHFTPDRTINRLAGIVAPLLRENTCIAEEELFESFSNSPPSAIASAYNRIQKRYPETDLEGTMNSLGYEFLSRSHNELAIAIFDLNVRKHPRSWNAWDSLGEGYEINGNFENAKLSFETSLEFNPNSESAKAAITRLNERH